MGLDLYYLACSPPCRAVMMTAKTLGIDLNYKIVNLLEKEQLSPEFVKINPQHTIPTLDDNGFVLWESRAIMQYLANAYAKTDVFYSKVAKKPALVDQRLSYDYGTLSKAFRELNPPVVFMKNPIDPEKLASFNAALAVLEDYLSHTRFSAGETLTIADFTIMATLSTAEASGHNFKEFSLVGAYMTRCKNEIKGFKENEDGAKFFGNMVKESLRNQQK